ncbi:hypothetical protein HPB49_026351 [Dermacentor silvarum]|nr:hypothetical protein HPB49_026351 [Dermacentor silvarum]
MSSSAATSFIDQLKLLYDNKLYSNVTALFSLAHPISTDCPDFMTVSAKFQSYVYCGDAYVQLGDFKRAEAFYQKAIQLKKSAAKAKGKGPTSIITGDVTSGNDIIAYRESNATAGSTWPWGSCISSGNERLAIACYREVLKECPLALQAAKSLLELGVKAEQVAALVLHPGGSSGSSLPPDMEWLGQWIKANAYLHSREYSSTLLAKEKKVKELQSLSSQLMSVNSRSPEPWIVMAYLCYVIKKGNRAIYFAQKAYIHQQRAYDRGIQLLQKHLESQSTCRLNQMLGDFYDRTGEHDKALQHLTSPSTWTPATQVQGASAGLNNDPRMWSSATTRMLTR